MPVALEQKTPNQCWSLFPALYDNFLSGEHFAGSRGHVLPGIGIFENSPKKRSCLISFATDCSSIRTRFINITLCTDAKRWDPNGDVLSLSSITGCRRTAGQEPQPTECNACRFLKLPVTGECVKECPGHQKPDDGGVFCGKEEKYFNQHSITYTGHVQLACVSNVSSLSIGTLRTKLLPPPPPPPVKFRKIFNRQRRKYVTTPWCVACNCNNKLMIDVEFLAFDCCIFRYDPRGKLACSVVCLLVCTRELAFAKRPISNSYISFSDASAQSRQNELAQLCVTPCVEWHIWTQVAR